MPNETSTAFEDEIGRFGEASASGVAAFGRPSHALPCGYPDPRGYNIENMCPTIIDVPGLPPANTTYSQVSIAGDLVFVSGQIGVDPATGLLVEGGIQAQTRQAIENTARCLAAAGTSLAKVAKVTLYLADFSMIGAANEIYAQYFEHRPAKTGMGVAGLWGEALIEIEVIASR